MTNIMTRAWEIAREGQENFGGKVSEYLSESLKIAWAEVKEEENNFVASWTNERGMKIEVEAEHITKKVVGYFGPDREELYDKVDEMKITKLVLAGESVDVSNLMRSKRESAIMGRTTFRNERMEVTVMLPTEVESKIWGAYDERQARRKAISEKLEAEQEHMNNVYNVLGCGA